MPRTRTAALLAAAALLLAGLAGCGDDDGDGADASADTSAPTDTTTGEPPVDERGAELDEAVAAVVDGQEIPAAGIDGQVDALAENPELAAQFEGEQGEQLRSTLRAELLSVGIQVIVAETSAEQLDRPVTDEDVAATRAGLEDEAGGADELQASIEQQGLTDEQLEQQLRGMAALDNVEEALAEQSDGTEADPEEGAMTPADQHFTEALEAADVIVNDDFGAWDPQAGQVIPPGGPLEAPGQLGPDEGGS